MVDLETLGKGNSSAIIALGAVKFSLAGITERFYVPIDPRSCEAYGLKLDADTVMWWFREDMAEARKAFLDVQLLDLATALEGFEQWIGPESLPIWGNGATFDNVILSNAYAATGGAAPWSYKDDRCYRTMRALGKANGVDLDAVKSVGTSHNALDDATYQAELLIHICKTLDLNL